MRAFFYKAAVVSTPHTHDTTMSVSLPCLKWSTTLNKMDQWWSLSIDGWGRGGLTTAGSISTTTKCSVSLITALQLILF